MKTESQFGNHIGTLATIRPNLTKTWFCHAGHCNTHVHRTSSPKCKTYPAHTANTEKYLTYMDKAGTEDPQQGPNRTFLGPKWRAWGVPPVIRLVSSELCGVGLFQLEWVEQHTLDATPAPTHPPTIQKLDSLSDFCFTYHCTWCLFLHVQLIFVMNDISFVQLM